MKIVQYVQASNNVQVFVKNEWNIASLKKMTPTVHKVHTVEMNLSLSAEENSLNLKKQDQTFSYLKELNYLIPAI